MESKLISIRLSNHDMWFACNSLNYWKICIEESYESIIALKFDLYLLSTLKSLN